MSNVFSQLVERRATPQLLGCFVLSGCLIAGVGCSSGGGEATAPLGAGVSGESGMVDLSASVEAEQGVGSKVETPGGKGPKFSQ
ncbi:hypothetical protein [Tautonia sociabilis]|uniref:Uncharacterized protein n=1 Tax=Tautonia sociabilis TaxID=2080755 RepID=A0A432MG63_9BACT|nr:hypothetical protein [Tautonia sociabilis]RUL85378.1 hypothetical protein TsocGM_18555 [Tautonia sociabilis]